MYPLSSMIYQLTGYKDTVQLLRLDFTFLLLLYDGPSALQYMHSAINTLYDTTTA
jgi:hypothetical protein